MFKNSLFHVICLFRVFSFVTSKEVVVETTTGPIRGKLNYYRNTNYESYEGIPFAEPPIGDLRFRPPVAIKPWKSILDATEPGCACPQLEYFHVRSEMDENCLFLNVYVPDVDCVAALPVYIYIHGGFFSLSSGRPTPIHGPQLFLQKGFIVITINYRLGALGFLSLGTVDASGNYGLKDILLALKWIKSNIVKFGGNPNTMCIHGLGSGAILTHYLLLTNQTNGLSQRAVLTSGNALSYRALQINPRENVLKLAREMGIKYEDDHCLLKKLKEADVFTIIDAQEYIIKNDPRRAFVLRDYFSPTIEIPSPIAFITKHPMDITRTEGLIQKIPVMTGFGHQEGLEMFSILKNQPHTIDLLNNDFELCIPSNIRYPKGSKMSKDLAKSIKQFYFNDCDISIVTVQDYINLISDTAYIFSMDYWIKLYKSQKYSSVIYFYDFSFDGELNWAKLFEDIKYPGTCHADEMGYYWVTNVTKTKLKDIDIDSKIISDGILYSLRNFTIYGKPTVLQLGGFKWVEAGPNREHLVYDKNPYNVYGPPIPKRLKFWYDVIAKYEKYESSKKDLIACNT